MLPHALVTSGPNGPSSLSQKGIHLSIIENGTQKTLPVAGRRWENFVLLTPDVLSTVGAVYEGVKKISRSFGPASYFLSRKWSIMDYATVGAVYDRA
jgi:hypothetical protein